MILPGEHCHPKNTAQTQLPFVPLLWGDYKSVLVPLQRADNKILALLLVRSQRQGDVHTIPAVLRQPLKSPPESGVGRQGRTGGEDTAT